MPIFSIKGNKLDRILEVPFAKEKEDIQKLVEANLNAVFSLDFVASEFAVGDLRIDTLAYDAETRSFVIIEYKKDKNFSVIDQGYAYLALLLNNKSDFILEYNETQKKNMKRDDIDWTQSRVIFVSPEFTKYQRKAIEFKDLPIELWEIQKFQNNSMLFNQLKAPESKESITTISSSNEVVSKVNREVKVYSEEYHLKDKPDEIKEIYEELKTRILNLGENIEIRPRKVYVAFVAKTNFVDVNIGKAKMFIWLNMKKGSLDDPRKTMEDVTSKGHWGNGDYELEIDPKVEIDWDYVMTLVKQSFKKNSN